MIENENISRLPDHLKDFIIGQHYERYTPQDQAVWRYVMRQNVKYLGKTAHSSYIKGLQKTGISINHIPTIEEMNIALGKLGWAAITVDGFIPPTIFMEFQAYKVLVIAADIRSVNQIDYTPAPDIIHEAAGHAPIIADKKYAKYLRYFGEIGSKAFSSAEDYKMYTAIRHLSILKADPNTAAASIEIAEKTLNETVNSLGMPSEMTLIRNLHWWTVEYGLIGTIEKPKIYGAGLLSSIAESKNALNDLVKKIPYSLNAMEYDFDITKPQPQLFVTPDFDHLIDVLNSFSKLMALKTGGLKAIMKAVNSGNTATLTYSSGLQVSGTFTDVLLHNGIAIYINTTGPSTLNYNNKILIRHTKEYHHNGFGSPIGKLKSCKKPIRLFTDSDLYKLGIQKGRHCRLEFESEIIVEGSLISILRKNGNIILMNFADCKVIHNGQTLFEPSWGIYDMAVGEKIISAFNGPADPVGFNLHFKQPEEKTHKIVYNEKSQKLFHLYQLTLSLNGKKPSIRQLQHVWNTFLNEKHTDWLLPIELLYGINGKDDMLTSEILKYLNKIKIQNGLLHLVEEGIKNV